MKIFSIGILGMENWKKLRGGAHFDDSTKSVDEFKLIDTELVGRVPPHGLYLEYSGFEGDRGETMQDLVTTCLDLGCIAFTLKSKRFFKKLISPKHWIDSEDEEDCVYVVDGIAPPFHLVDLTYEVSPEVMDEEFESLAVDVSFLCDIPRSTNLYFCLFGGWFNLGAFYGGLQTNVGCPNRSKDEKGPRIEVPTKSLHEWTQAEGQEAIGANYGAIFSRWGPANIGDVAIPTDDESFGEAAGYEGDFCSVRRHVAFGEGKYRLTIFRQETIPDTGTWLRFQVHDLTPGKQSIHDVGYLFFRGSEPLKLAHSTLYNFVEIYGEETSLYIDEYCPFQIEIGNLQFNNRKCPTTKRCAEFFKLTPLFCSVEKGINDNDGVIRVSFGGEIMEKNHFDYGKYLCNE